MAENVDHIMAEALSLPPLARAELVEKILASFEFRSRKEIDERWAEEAENRVDAYERGEIEVISAREVFERIDNRQK